MAAWHQSTEVLALHTMPRCPATVAAAFLLLCGAANAADPSGGWLSYAVFKAKPTDIITKLSATMIVPPSPKTPHGAPAFWFGVQTEHGDGALVQPIMSKWLGDSFYMFQEIFDWTDRHDDQTHPMKVQAGDVVSASVTYVKADNSYNMNMTCARTGATSNYNYKLERRQKATESVGYFVLEHQVSKCTELPPSGVVTWSNVQVEVNGSPVQHATWVAKEESPVCGAKAVVVNSSTIEITWTN